MTRGAATVLLTLALAVAGATAALAQEPGSPADQGLGRLITQTAKRGTLKPVKGAHHLALKLRGVAPQVVWFDDRPARRTGQIPVGRFVRSWARFGFEEVPPNAALTLLDASDDEDTVVLKLGAPHYNRKTRTVRYPAKLLHRATGNLSHLERQRDDHVPRHFTSASLFIDDAGYGLPAGCQPGLPYIKCTYTSSTTLSVDSMVSQLQSGLGRPIDSPTPLWVQAWGGRGAKGASDRGDDGAFGGYAGYAISVPSVGALSGDELYLYVGASGSEHANSGGQGGASTIVSTQAISRITDFPGGLQVVAGGSGGGARGCGGVGRGGGGGVAIASNALTDQSGAGPSGGGRAVGQGGSGGDGGGAGDTDEGAGTDGLGGYGGQGKLSSTVGWVNLDAVDPAAAGWTTGAGGGGHGGGGGGYGGGGSGGACGGGGGGGSWARSYVRAMFDPDSPLDSEQADGAQSKVVLTFNLG